ncbi:lipopolysaccharide biosynthesis protein [Calothrix sp. FACHB-156]|nr:lipopolysaccharide biosynthesis protein [Nostoc linckia FACHB-104]MBD2338984.1 lipopolysaccharide biosynthesis protein [Calothrix sp. FACHB-156]
MTKVAGFASTLIQKLFANQLIRNLSWLGAAEIINRIFRLLTTVVLARLLHPYDYGLAAIVLTTNEFVKVFTSNGIWAKLVQADEKDIKELSQTAYWLNWFVCGALFLIQCLVAFPVAWLYHDQQVILPICVIALVYLIIPVGLVQASLIQRENKLHIMALAGGLTTCLDNILAIILAFLGWGMWAMVLPKVLIAPIWAFVYYRHHKWRPPQKFTLAKWQEIVNFSKSILGVELLATLRNNLDYLIAGRFLGVEALGIYYFAFNAGLGISLSIINALDTALFPHFCTFKSDPEKFKHNYLKSLKTIGLLIIPLVVLQSSLANFYVPIIFGQKWIAAIPILILICLSAIPRPFANAASQSLWALNKPHWDLRWNLCFTAIFAAALFIGVQWNILGLAIGVLVAHAIALPIYTFVVTLFVLKEQPSKSEVVTK